MNYTQFVFDNFKIHLKKVNIANLLNCSLIDREAALQILMTYMSYCYDKCKFLMFLKMTKFASLNEVFSA